MRKSKATALHRFRLQYPKAPDGIHIFVEGRDDVAFYLSFIHRFCPVGRSVTPYECGNRRSVLDTRLWIEQESTYKSACTLFFVDKDYSDFLGEMSQTVGNLFCTSCYSIENYLASERMLERLWVEFFHIRRMELEFEPIADHYRDQFERFREGCRDICAWIIAVRLHGENPTLNEIRMDSIFRFDELFDLNYVGWDDCRAHLEDVCKVETDPVAETAMETIALQLNHLDHKCWVRGKFELWFFVQFVGNLEAAIRRNLLPGAKLQIRTRLTLSNSVEVLASKCDTPDPLAAFLLSNISGAP